LRACLESLPAGAPPATLGNSGGCAAIYGRCRALLKICAQVGPRLLLTYDVGNWLLVGEDPLETLDTVFERVVHVHLKDWVVLRASERPLRAGLLRLSRDLALRVRRHYAPPFLRSAAARVGLSERIGRAVPAANGDIYRSVPLGDGIVPLEALFCRLRAAGYLGYLSLEYEGAGDLGGAYRRGRAYLTERLPAS
jgi:sugar phosphate isomerase/epimerase